jgi:MerR family transcriptional regulator, light-induced transcriptional regulator
MAIAVGFGSQPERNRNEASRRNRPRRPKHLGELLSLSVVPRFLVAHSDERVASNERKGLVAVDDIERLAPVALTESAHVLLDQVEAVMRRGVTAEEVFVDLLAPIARWMGREWDEDRLSFVDVSMGLWRLQEVLREIAAGAAREDGSGDRNAALFAAMPGDQHTFGASMMQECFAIAGWDSELLIEANNHALIDSVAERNFDLLGLTLTNDCPSTRVADLIRTLRSVSRNPRLCVMIGGRLPTEQPDMVVLTGANGTAATAPEAVRTAARLIDSMRMAATA